MNIAMMTNSYKPFVGGVPISIERLAQGLRANGHRVYIFAPEYGQEEVEEDVIRYASFGSKVGVFTLPNSFDRSIIKAFRKLAIDVIHVHQPMLMGNTALYLSRRFRVPLVFTWHTLYGQYLHYLKTFGWLERISSRGKDTFSGRIAARVMSSFSEGVVPQYMKRYANKCDRVFVPTKSTKESLLTMGVKAPVHVLPTGIPEDYFQADQSEVHRIREEHAPQGQRLFCSVSRLGKEKNVTFLLRALSEYRRNHGEDFCCIVAGEGPDREELESKADNLGIGRSVKFIGGVPNERLKNFYAAADAFLFASKTETQGIVLLEAMSGGTPVVAVKASAVGDVVDDGRNGRLTTEDPALFADALHDMLSDQDAYDGVAAQARETALGYAGRHIAEQAEGVYLRALEGRIREESHETVQTVYPVPEINRTHQPY